MQHVEDTEALGGGETDLDVAGRAGEEEAERGRVEGADGSDGATSGVPQRAVDEAALMGQCGGAEDEVGCGGGAGRGGDG